ncbi:GH17502 [Drosophila grimshawi]|uniref:GH17502 n=1 Tax=Drosophila grimshawi TaxID=7222 RepID=B4JTW8_DROGR|nr:GH17502 [Drosophila grimshawi]
MASSIGNDDKTHRATWETSIANNTETDFAEADYSSTRNDKSRQTRKTSIANNTETDFAEADYSSTRNDKSRQARKTTIANNTETDLGEADYSSTRNDKSRQTRKTSIANNTETDLGEADYSSTRNDKSRQTRKTSIANNTETDLGEADYSSTRNDKSRQARKTTIANNTETDLGEADYSSTRNDNNGKVKCTSEGFIGDLDNCAKFYRCIGNGKGGYDQVPFHCAAGTVWDQDLQTCNHDLNMCNPIVEEGNGNPTTESDKGPCDSTTAKPITTTTMETTITPSTMETTTTNRPTEPTTDSTTEQTSTTNQPTTIQPTTNQPTTNQPTTTMLTTTDKPTTTESTGEANPSTTTMIPPTTTQIPNLPPGTECKGEGFMPDPNNCRKFYRCQKTGDSYSKHEFMCPKNTGWNVAIQTCDHASNVSSCSGQTDPPMEATTNPGIITTETHPAKPTTTETPTISTTVTVTKPTDPPTKPTTEYPTTTENWMKPTDSTIKPTDYPGKPTDYPTTPETKPTDYPTTKPTTTTEMYTESTTRFTTSMPGYPPTTEDNQGTTTEDSNQGTTKEPETNFRCPSEGFHADPQDCSIYYRCTKHNDNYQAYKFRCSNGTVWDSSLETCNHADQVSGNCSSGSITTTGKPWTEQPTSTKEPIVTTAKPDTTTKTPPSPTDRPVESTTKPIETTTEKQPTKPYPEPSANTSAPCPTITEEQSLFVCPSGFRRHSKNCGMFYQCNENSNSNLNIVLFQCPNGTVYLEGSCRCGEPEPNDRCSNKGSSRTQLFDEVKIKSELPLCPEEGHFALNQDECSQVFVKCVYSHETGRIEGQINRCPQGFVYWNVSRRCEQARKLTSCIPATYNVGESVPLEWVNIGHRRRSLRI